MYDLLSIEPAPVAALAFELGVKDGQARRLLCTLEEHDLAERGPDGWVRGRGDLMQVEVELDVQGKTLAQYLQHRVERHAFRRDRARRAGRTEPYVEPIYGEQTGELLAVEWLDPDTRSLHAVPNTPFFTDPDRVLARRQTIDRLVAMTSGTVDGGDTMDWGTDERRTAAGDRDREADRSGS